MTKHVFNFARSIMTAAVIIALVACAAIVGAAVFLVVVGRPIPESLGGWVSLVLATLLANLGVVKTLFEKSASEPTP